MGNTCNSLPLCTMYGVRWRMLYVVGKKVQIQYKAQGDIYQTFVCFISFRVPQWPDDRGKIKAREDTEGI